MAHTATVHDLTIERKKRSTNGRVLLDDGEWSVEVLTKGKYEHFTVKHIIRDFSGHIVFKAQSRHINHAPTGSMVGVVEKNAEAGEEICILHNSTETTKKSRREELMRHKSKLFEAMMGMDDD